MAEEGEGEGKETETADEDGVGAVVGGGTSDGSCDVGSSGCGSVAVSGDGSADDDASGGSMKRAAQIRK